ncbi:MAG: PorT family protein, partial [Prevotella sp.]|nr:PorT family protein [Prevotella sp.]
KIVTRNFQCILNYLNLPVTVTFNVIGWRNAVFSVKGGFQLGYLVSSKTKNSIDFFNKEDGLWVLNKEKSGMVSGSNNSIYKKMNVAIPVGVEFEYKKLSLGLQYVIGLTKIYSGMNNNINNRSFVLSMGYGITL